MGLEKGSRADRGKSPTQAAEAPDGFETWTGSVQNPKMNKSEVEIQIPSSPSSYRARKSDNRRGLFKLLVY